MLGPAFGSCGGMASAIEAYRLHGLFDQWPIDYLPTHGGLGAGHSAGHAGAAFRRMMRLLASERVLAVHVHAAAGPGFWRDAGFMASAWGARCPLVLHLHGGDLRRLHDASGMLARASMRWLLQQAACVLVPCEFMRKRVAQIARRARVEYLPPPAAPVPPPQPTTERPNLVLYLGRLEAAKGVFDLLEAVSRLRPAIADVRLVCAGEGDPGPLRRHAAQLGIADAVKFTGWVGPSGKRALLESAAVFALPSYEDDLPVALLEAMAAGVPAVVSPLGGVPEFVADGVSGLFCAPGDVATLQRLLTQLLLDRRLGTRIGAAGRESITLRCAPKRALTMLGHLYAELGLPSLAVPPAPNAVS